MENQIDVIEKQIEQLKKSIIDRYDEDIKDIDKNISFAKEVSINKADEIKANLLKELDDRLALIKQFPSVLDADFVSIKEIPNLSEINFYSNMSGNERLNLPSNGKWKVLILAKKII